MLTTRRLIIYWQLSNQINSELILIILGTFKGLILTWHIILTHDLTWLKWGKAVLIHHWALVLEPTQPLPCTHLLSHLNLLVLLVLDLVLIESWCCWLEHIDLLELRPSIVKVGQAHELIIIFILLHIQTAIHSLILELLGMSAHLTNQVWSMHLTIS